MMRPALGGGFTMAAMLGVSLAVTSMLALAGEPSAGPPRRGRPRSLQESPPRKRLGA